MLRRCHALAAGGHAVRWHEGLACPLYAANTKYGRHSVSPTGRPPDFMHREISSKPERPAEDSGLGRTPFEVQAKIEEMMAQAGCQQPNEVLLAAKRLLKEGEPGCVEGAQVWQHHALSAGLPAVQDSRLDVAPTSHPPTPACICPTPIHPPSTQAWPRAAPSPART